MSFRTRNFLTFVNTTAIAYWQKIARSLMILVLCNSSRVYNQRVQYNTTIAKKKKITTTPARPKSNIVPAMQHTSTCQRKNTDKAAEAQHYLVLESRRTLLGRGIVEIGVPQSKSAP